ncbi:N-alpha-acetyltransferase 40 [Monosporozyma unispora]
MGEKDKQRNFLSQLMLCFPETLLYNPEGEIPSNKQDATCKTLHRRILFIGNDSKSEKIPDKVHNYCTLEKEVSKEHEVDQEMLNKLLEILDTNLGQTYERVSSTIYENKVSWKDNKWEEMLSSDLVYVTYGLDDTKTRTFVPLMYLSFMLTEEIDISKINLTEHVIYLYEIQLLPELRGQGIGQKMMECLKDTSIKYNETKSYGDIITSVALTVFSSNEAAFRFYKKMGFEFTAGSPRDEKIMSIASRTRKRFTGKVTEDISGTSSTKGYRISKPIYYLLYLPLK